VPAGDLVQPMLKLGVLLIAGASGLVARFRRAVEVRRSKWDGLTARPQALTGWK